MFTCGFCASLTPDKVEKIAGLLKDAGEVYHVTQTTAEFAKELAPTGA